MSDSCYPGGTATVVARSVADTSLFGTAQAIVTSTLEATVSIASIVDAGTGQPARLDSLTDSVHVVININLSQLPCVSASEADLVIARPQGDTIVDRVALDSAGTVIRKATLTFHSDAKIGGVPQFPNGQYTMAVEMPLSSGPVQRSSTMSFTIKNP